MSAQRASAPARFAVVLSAIVLVAVAAAVAVRLAGRREAPAPPAAAPPPKDRVVDLKERVRHEEYEAGRLVAEIRGDTFALGPDGRNHLAGSVEVTYYGRDGTAASRLTAGEIVYAPGAQRFTVLGDVRVEAGDVVLEGDSFEYDKSAGLFETATGGRFASRTVSGSCARDLLCRSRGRGPARRRLPGRDRNERAGRTGPWPSRAIPSSSSAAATGLVWTDKPCSKAPASGVPRRPRRSSFPADAVSPRIRRLRRRRRGPLRRGGAAGRGERRGPRRSDRRLLPPRSLRPRGATSLWPVSSLSPVRDG